jgi:ATP-binding cassette subfamily B protein
MVAKSRTETVEPTDDEDEPETIARGDLARIRDFLWPFVRMQRLLLFALVAILLVETMFEVMFPLAQRHIIDKGLVEKDLGVITYVLIFLAISAVIVNVLGLAADYVYCRIAAAVVGDIRADMHAHLLDLQFSDLERTPRGATLSRFAGDVQNIESMLLEIVPWLIHPTLQVIYSTLLMFYFNFWLGLLSALIFPIVLILPRRLAKKSFELSYAKRQREATMLSHLQETLGSLGTVKAFGLEPRRQRRYARLNNAWRMISFRTAFTGALVERSAFAALYTLHVVVFSCGVWAVYTGSITLGTLVAYEALFLSMGEALTYATQFVPRIAAAAGSIRYINELTGQQRSAPDPAGALPVERSQGALTFRDVTFDHADARFRLGPLDLEIAGGSRVALVGASGSGKSTLLALILRLRDPIAGRIELDGRDVSMLQRRSYQSRIGFVPQEAVVFEGTIAENIALGAVAPSRRDIEAAAADAELLDFVRSLPRGFDTRIGPASGELSVGQRQRLSIARALVRDPDILVLDEPTSALDAETGASLNTTLWRLPRRCTLVCATHQLHNVTPFADRIVVLDQGRVAETGNHGELLAQGGAYARLWSSQSGTLITGN